MDNNTISRLEKELTSVLREEYSFYQSLYVMLDKQRDLIRFNNDDKLLDLFTEIERCHRRITQSEEKIQALRQRDDRLFKLASVSPDVRKIVNGITTMVKKCMTVVEENEEFMRTRYNRVRDELGELKNSHKILQYLSHETPSSQFVDGTQ